MPRLLALTALALAALSCAPRDGAPARPVVALVMKSLANEFFKTMEDGARAHQAANADRYELVATGIKDEQDVARQIAIVDQMVARRVAAIVIAPADSKALVGVLGRAADAGIVVVNIDNRLDRDALAERGLTIPFVGPDNRAGARAVGAVVAARLAKGDRIAILEGAPNAFNGIERTRGFQDAAAAAGLVVARSQSAHWETGRANQVASAIVAELPDIKAILCGNDSMALGALAALKAAGRQDSVLVAGFDNISAVRSLVERGEIVATADQHAGELAAYGIDYALQQLASPGSRPADRTTPVEVVTAGTAR